MKTLMVDMDNVITDGSFNKIIEEFFNTKVILDENTSYYYVQEYTESRKKDFWEYMENKSFYEEAPLIDGTYDVLEELNKLYDLYIVTSYVWKESKICTANNLKEKYLYLQKYLPFIDANKYIFTTNKNIMKFDIGIDDKISNLSSCELQLLFDAWHNKKVDCDNKKLIRVKNWYEVKKVLI